jgi:hypothetical protein
MDRTKGAVYLLIDASYLEEYFHDLDITNNFFLKELAISVNSLHKHMPELPVTVYTNLKVEDIKRVCSVDEVINIPIPKYRFWADKFKVMRDSPYDKTLFLDGDTYFCDKIDEVWETLDKYDLAAMQSPSLISRDVVKVPPCFPELAGGVIFYKKNEKTNKLFENIITMLDVPERRPGCDEPYLRFALYESSDLRFYVLPTEYNCFYTHPGYLFGKVKILHGHSDSIEEDAEVVNSRIYENYPPWKRLFTGKAVLLYKKDKRKVMHIEKEIPYKGIKWGMRA